MRYIDAIYIQFKNVIMLQMEMYDVLVVGCGLSFFGQVGK